MKPTFRSLVLASALLVGVGCTEGLHGVPMKEPAATGKVFASISAKEPGGLVVLWNGQVIRERHGTPEKWTTWVAGSQEELDAVWKVAAQGPPPSVDFASYVVFAAAGPEKLCLPPITGLDVEVSGLLLLRTGAKGEPLCGRDSAVVVIDGPPVPVARIIAVPRRALPTTVVFFEGYAFEVPDVPFG